ncbi:uncharacterized protein UHOD_12390 [Ustilago sp. UG-2017b]|nr:uncharacterized protein UHOD_12390 [Ustilago sp. UG-2017b]
MSNHDYSVYEDFVQDVKDIIHCLPPKLQGRFHRMITNKAYGMLEELKDRPIFDYCNGTNSKQVVTPLTILIGCASHLYFATHKLSPFHNHFDLGKQMRARINFFITNEESDASQILDLKIEGSEAQHSETSDKPLRGREATPTATPELTQLTNHHLKVLSTLNNKLRWDEKDLLNPKKVLVHAWQQQLCKKLSVIPFACDVLDCKTTFTNVDSLLCSIIMNSFSPQLQTEYFSEHRDRPIKIAVDLFDWAIAKCTVHLDSKEYELLKAMYALKWDQVGSRAYDFLTKWESNVSKLHAYLIEPWTPMHRYKTLKCALPGDKNALFNSIFILNKTLNKEHTKSSVANVLCKCYKLAADSAPVCVANNINNSDLSALHAATLINCWACGDDGHPANCCPNESTYNKWKKDRVKPPPPYVPPGLVPFVFDSGTSCVMVNSEQHGKGWCDADDSVTITTTDGSKLPVPKIGGTVSLLSLSPTTKQWEQMTYDNCLLVPGLVTNLIGTKTVTQAKGKVTFEDEPVTVQDCHGHTIGVPISSNGYPAAGMIIWDNTMPKPKVSLAFTGMWQRKT